jgi:hypothetical protein
MKCTMYKKFQAGRLNQQEYRLHEQNCPACREAHAQDRKLMAESRKLKVPVDTSAIWTKLESSLKNDPAAETRPGKIRLHRLFPVRLGPVPIAAVSLAGIFLLGLLVWNTGGKQSSGLLSGQALNRVEKIEHAYMAAIDELEKQIGPSLESMDMELSLLYRDRLETIDEQIQQCRNALMQNPANYQIRRYLLTALRDKKDTLREIMVFESEST